MTVIVAFQSLVFREMEHHSGQKIARKTKQNNGVFDSVSKMATFDRKNFLMLLLKELSESGLNAKSCFLFNVYY